MLCEGEKILIEDKMEREAEHPFAPVVSRSRAQWAISVSQREEDSSDLFHFGHFFFFTCSFTLFNPLFSVGCHGEAKME